MLISPTNYIFDRTGVSVSEKDLVDGLEKRYPQIGKINLLESITEGYEDANILMTANKGKYVAKFFAKWRTPKNRRDYTNVLRILFQNKIPVMEIISGENNFIENIGGAELVITRFFNGKNFTTSSPDTIDCVTIAKYLAEINNLSIEVEDSYDSWGNKNLLGEFEKNKSVLSASDLELLESLVKEYKQINLESFPKTFIHGDLQRKHILKNSFGKYCILDFGCMANAPAVIDLSTYLAWFCLQEDTWSDHDDICNRVLKTYTEIHPLTYKEIECLPILVKSSYAAYFLKTSILKNSGDDSEETNGWYQKAKKMMELSIGWK